MNLQNKVKIQMPVEGASKPQEALVKRHQFDIDNPTFGTFGDIIRIY